MKRPLRIGLLGASNLAVSSIIEPAQKLENVEVRMVAARDYLRAKNYAQEHNIPIKARDYNELLKSGEIDLVYICLPNILHEEWGISAFENKINVLLEKPAAPNYDAAIRLLAAANKNNCRLIEGFHYYYHPLFGAIKNLLADKRLGEIKSFYAKLDVPLPPAQNLARWNPLMGGGVMRDIGCYPVHWARHLVGEFTPIHSEITIAETGVDEKLVAQIAFANGAIGTIDVSMTPHDGQRFSRLNLELSNGAIDVSNMVLPHFGHTLKWRIGEDWHQNEMSAQNPQTTETTFYYQLKAIRDALSSGDALPTEGDDIANNSKSIDAILNK